jgi:glycosyltransferase involved in cell wall biosynthesis
MSGDGPLPTVSVVIPTRNRRQRIERTVRALLADPAATEVVVVDDGSTDGTTGLLEALAVDEPRLRSLRTPPRGQDFARQAGAEVASGDVLLTIDDDVVATPGLVTGHARHHAGRRGLVVVGYMPVRTPCRRRPGQFATYLYAQNYEWACRRWEREPEAVLRYLWGGNLSLRRADALRVGFVSPSGRLPYNEDQEFGLRLLRAGAQGVFDRSLLAHHEHERDLDGYLREGRVRAVGAMTVHAAHGDLLGPFRLERYEDALPRQVRWAVRAARRPAIANLEVRLLRPLIRLSGLARWWQLESLAATLALHVIEVRTVVTADAQPIATP